MGKDIFRAAGPGSLEGSLELETHAQTQAAQTKDHRQGVAAFRGKRKPLFHGR